MSGCSRNVGTQESAVWQVLETEILAEKADASGEVDFTHDYSEEIKADIEDVVSKSESLQKELEQIETDLDTLGKEKAGLERDLASGTLPYDKIQEVSARFGEVKDLMDEKEMRWLELQDSIR